MIAPPSEGGRRAEGFGFSEGISGRREERSLANGQESERTGSCARCAAELDPLRAPALGIVESRVLPFCSAECKTGYFEVVNAREAEVELAAAEAVVRKARAHHELTSGIVKANTRAEARTAVGPAVRITGKAVEADADADDARLPGSPGLFRRWWRGSGTPAMVAVFAVVGFGALAAAGYRLLAGVTRPENRRYRPAVRPEPRPLPDAALERKAPTAQPKRVRPQEVLGQAKKVLGAFLKQEGTRHQLVAAEVLGGCCQEPGALEVLLSACKDSLWSRRQQAAAALARMGNDLGLKVLKKDLAHRRRAVRWAAAFNLARLGDRSGLSVIRPLLSKKRYRLTCAEALIKLGDTRAKRYLVKVLDMESARSSDRLRAAVALGLAGDGRGAGLLREAVGGQRVHLGAALALARLQDPLATDALVRALDHTALRLEAARALRRLGTQVSLAKLVDRMKDPDAHGQISAAAAVLLLTRDARADSRRTGGGAAK